jgi:nitrogen regulatory protein P-II 1
LKIEVREDDSKGQVGPNLILRESQKKGLMIMKKMEAVIQPSKLDAVKEALQEIGIQGMTVSEVRGHGRQKGHSEIYRGHEYTVDLLPKLKVEVVLPETLVEQAMDAIVNAARSGKIGDGKIFLSDIGEAIRIRDGQRGDEAL